jgi:hypothetical protein
MVYSWLMDEMRYEVGRKRYFVCVLVNRRWVGYCRSLWLVDMGGGGEKDGSRTSFLVYTTTL